MADELGMMWDEVADIGHLLHQLDETALDAPSLCRGWAVRDVLGHMGLGHTVPMPAMVARIAKYGFNVTKASFNESKTMFEGKSAEAVRRFWDEVMVAQHPMKGIAKLIPARAGFLDHLVHNQDIRRPTGAARTIPSERLLRALELVRTEGTPMFNPKRTVRGLKLVASDLGWGAGDGPVVEGPGEAIVMAGAGRAAALDDLSGPGVGVLRERLSA
ncbi:MAG TPA: maleylpyruvate isomerase family mycothiol-dependent enzyme [Acidimicrobiales bacterium]|nr:maleylpyruvate isomerase family mycothiol-dependent enzyme [Acidimicrobiales bacterium]